MFAEAIAAGVPTRRHGARERGTFKRPDFSVRLPGAEGESGRVRYCEWKVATLCKSNYTSRRQRSGDRQWGAQGRADRETRRYDGRGAAGSGAGLARTEDERAREDGPLRDSQLGPMQRRWQQVGGITTMAVGAFGEVSGSVTKMMQDAARYAARRRWRLLGCESEAEARSLIGTMLVSRCGIAFTREMANLVLNRLCLVGSRSGEQGTPGRMVGDIERYGHSDLQRGQSGEHWRESS